MAVQGERRAGAVLHGPLTTRTVVVGLVVLAGAVTALYAVRGTGWVLDDWYTLANARFDGAFGAAGEAQRTARPGAWVTYAVVFGLLGEHPAAVLALQGAIVGASAVLLFLLLRRLVAPTLAAATAALWLVLPNHTSLEVWASATNIGLALAATLGGLLLLLGPAPGGGGASAAPVASGCSTGRAVAGGLLLAVGTLSYEAVVPVAAVAVLALPWLVHGRPDRRALVAGWSGLGVASAWILVHWHPDKAARVQADLGQAVGAHLGWGIAPAGPAADLLTVVALVGIVVVLVRLVPAASRRRAGEAEWLVVAGLAVIVLGVVPFARYFYAPLGAGDRMTVVSGVGGAMVWAGLGGMVARWRTEAAVVAAAALVLVAGVARVERADRWHRAGRDADAVLDEVQRRFPVPPQGTIVVGPHPVQEQNVVAFVDQSNILPAVQHRYGTEDVRVVLVFDEASFERAPEELRIDIVALSSLRDDAYGGG